MDLNIYILVFQMKKLALVFSYLSIYIVSILCKWASFYCWELIVKYYINISWFQIGIINTLWTSFDNIRPNVHVHILSNTYDSIIICLHFLYNVPSITFNDFNYFAGMFLSRYERFRNEVEKNRTPNGSANIEFRKNRCPH